MSKYIDAEKLKYEIERFNSLVPYENNDRHDEGLHDAYKAVKNVIASLQQEQPEVNLEEEFTDKSRACCNCINGVTRYPNCFCWQHKDCNTDEPYKIHREDWVKTAKTCREFEFELGVNARKEENK